MGRRGWRAMLGALATLTALACKPAPANAPQGKRTGVELEVPSRPEDLLHAGAIERVQDALAKQGLGGKFARGELDEATTASLRKLQEQRDLAQTGLPDRATLAALGLDPDDVYRARPIPESQESQRPATLREELNGGRQGTGGSGER